MAKQQFLQRRLNKAISERASQATVLALRKEVVEARNSLRSKQQQLLQTRGSQGASKTPITTLNQS